jgi:four helix bundle protein
VPPRSCCFEKENENEKEKDLPLMERWFDHEKLNVYQDAIAFCAWWEETGQACRQIPTVKDQLDRASTSIALNIAEGNGKQSPRDRCRYLQTATGSAFECAACLDILVARGRLNAQSATDGKRRLKSIVSMLVGLINVTTDRIQEEPEAYTVATSES